MNHHISTDVVTSATYLAAVCLEKPSKKASSNAHSTSMISALVGISHPKEVTPSFSEIAVSEKSPAHLQAIKDFNQFSAGEINATELKKRHTKTYKNWDDMKQRCNGDPAKGIPPIELHVSFKRFADFLLVTGPRPYPTWSIDRIDPSGPYSPDNCRWASKKAQSRNRTNTVYLTYEGEARPLVEWAEIKGVNPSTYRGRKNSGWTDRETIEGIRETGHTQYIPKLASKGQNPFDYTPWPTKMRESLEKTFQHAGKAGEHRLHFMKRYAALQINLISCEIDDVSWPEYYEPSIEEAGREVKVRMELTKWQSVFTDACHKLQNHNLPMPYLKFKLPAWAELKLAGYA